MLEREGNVPRQLVQEVDLLVVEVVRVSREEGEDGDHAAVARERQGDRGAVAAADRLARPCSRLRGIDGDVVVVDGATLAYRSGDDAAVRSGALAEVDFGGRQVFPRQAGTRTREAV